MTPLTDSVENIRPPAMAPRIVRALLGGGIVITGLVLAAVTAGLAPAEMHQAILLGAVGGFVTSALGTTVLARCATVPGDDPRAGQSYTLGLASNLGLQAVGAVVGIFAFSFTGQKFPVLAAFGLTFAAAAGLVQIFGALSISRFLRDRAAAASAVQRSSNAPR